MNEATVILGNAKAESMYCFMLVALYTAAAIVVFRFLAVDTGLRRELKDLFKREVPLQSKGKALFIVGVLWLLAAGWTYNATLGSKFFKLRHTGEGPAATWTFIYEFPRREREVPNAQIEEWQGREFWKRGSMKHSLEARLADGRILESAGVPPLQLRDQMETLIGWGIDIAQRKPVENPEATRP